MPQPSAQIANFEHGPNGWITCASMGASLFKCSNASQSRRALVPASLLSTVSVLVLAAVATGFAVAAALPGGDGIPCARCRPLEMWRWDDNLLDSAAVFMFAFVTHSILPQVNQRRPSATMPLRAAAPGGSDHV